MGIVYICSFLKYLNQCIKGFGILCSRLLTFIAVLSMKTVCANTLIGTNTVNAECSILAWLGGTLVCIYNRLQLYNVLNRFMCMILKIYL